MLYFRVQLKILFPNRGVANGKIQDSPRRRDWHLKIQAQDEKV